MVLHFRLSEILTVPYLQYSCGHTGLFRWTFLALICLRLPSAARFLSEDVSRQGVSSCSRAAADFAKFANTTLAFEIRGVPQRNKERGVPVEFGQRLFPDVARGDRQ